MSVPVKLPTFALLNTSLYSPIDGGPLSRTASDRSPFRRRPVYLLFPSIHDYAE